MSADQVEDRRAQQFLRVVEEHGPYDVEEKVGRAGEVARLTDRRGDQVP